MTREEEMQVKTEELYGKVNKSFPISEFVNEEKRNCFVAGAKWADKTMIEKACEWLSANIITVVTDDYTYMASVHNISREEFIEQFKKAMEE